MVDPNIKKKADDIRNKIYGKEVRESLASGLEEISSDVIENEGRQSVVEDRQDSVESQWQVVSDEMTDKDVISAPEIIAARDGEANLKARLDKENQEVTAQLAQTGHLNFFIPETQKSYYHNSDIYSDDVYSWYDDLVGKHTNSFKVMKETIGRDESNTYDIHKYIFEPKNYDREIILTSGMHGIENIPVFTLYEMMKHVVKGTGKNALFNYLRNRVKVVVIPFIAPWGFNQRPRVYANVNGVNINRNFILQEEWASSGGQASGIYDGKGTAPFSEVESRILREQIELYRSTSDFWFDLHSAAGWDVSYYVQANEDDIKMTESLSNAVDFIKDYNEKHHNDTGEGVFGEPNTAYKLRYAWKTYNLSGVTVELQPARYGNQYSGELDMTLYMLHLSNYLVSALNGVVEKEHQHSIQSEISKGITKTEEELVELSNNYDGEVIDVINQSVTISDHFNRADNTSIGITEKGDFEWASSDFELVDNSLKATALNASARATFDTLRSNFIIHADIKFGNSIGIVLRNFNLSARIRTYMDAQTVQLVDGYNFVVEEPLKLTVGETYHMMVVALDKRIMIYVDGVKYIDTIFDKYVDDTLVGVRTFNDTESALLNLDVKFIGGVSKVSVDLENGWTGQVDCEVNADGKVALRGMIDAGTGTDNTLVFTIPYKYRPKIGNNYVFGHINSRDPVGLVVNSANGQVLLQLPFGRSAVEPGDRVRFNAIYQS